MSVEESAVLTNAKFIAALDGARGRMKEFIDGKSTPTEMEQKMGHWEELIASTSQVHPEPDHKLVVNILKEYDAKPVMETLPSTSANDDRTVLHTSSSTYYKTNSPYTS